MSTVNSKFAQALFPLLTAALLTAGCSDAAGPVTDNGSSGQVTDAGTATPKGDSGPSPSTPSLADAPKVNWGAPGDTAATSPKVSFYTVSSPTANLRLAPGPGIVDVMRRGAPVQCWGGASRYIRLAGVLVFPTTGVSSYYQQAVTANVWLYRKSGTSWIAVDRLPASASLDLSAWLSETVFFPKQAGTYRVLIQMAWWVQMIPGQWMVSASANYDLNSPSEYVAGWYANTGPGGQCTVS
jgi:hypothetical protein